MEYGEPTPTDLFVTDGELARCLRMLYNLAVGTQVLRDLTLYLHESPTGHVLRVMNAGMCMVYCG